MRRAGGIVLSLLLAAVTVGSVLRVPRASRLSAIPAHANLVYSNGDPGGFRFAFPMLGKTGDELSNVWNKWFQALEKRPLAVATVPFAGVGQRDCWVAVSELDGATAFALRWRLSLFPPEGIRLARPYAGWPVWRVEDPALPSWAAVRVSITENLLVCSVSADSRDVYRLLDAADGRAASVAR